MILDWKLVSKNLDEKILKKILENKEFYESKYIAFVLFEENESSRSYIKMKEKKAKEFWIKTKLIDQVNLKNKKKAIWIIDILNRDDSCIWILTQLPFNKELKESQWEILWNISPLKDIDWLGWVMFWLSQIEYIHFLPATVRAVFEILNFYKIKVSWKTLAIIWQSNLIGKPLAQECARRMATVWSFNEFSDKEIMKNFCKKSDIIVSASWDLWSINKDFLSEDNMQILIDVWWWKKNWKASWDFSLEEKERTNHLYTPVPWWVWPVTVSCIFANLVDLEEIKKKNQ